MEERTKMAYETIIYEKKDHVAIITLNRPEKLNAENAQLTTDLAHAMADADRDKNIIVLIITGAGRAFCAGADLEEVASQDPAVIRKRQEAPNFFEILNKFSKPMIAAINGVTAGGGFELACYCDIVIAADTAMISDGHANFVGLGPKATVMAPYLMGRRKAAELLLTGDRWPASELEKAGFINHVVPADKLMEKAMEIAQKIASKMPLAMILAKSVIKRAGLVDQDSLSLYAAACLQRISNTKDFAEGMKAFAEKRKPKYIGE
jgi:enoyl-CoA hydratase/carnithine racemase